MICICKKCGKEFTSNSNRQFCSRKCANSHVVSEQHRIKTSNSMKKYYEINPAKNHKITRKCVVCKNEFTVYPSSKQKYCSSKCRVKDKSLYINCGGYREGSGRSKSGYYKGIYCGSTYELAYVIYRLDHNLPVKRFEGLLHGNDLIYIPDFIEDDTIIEIKGYYTELVEKKCNLAKDKGYNIKVLYINDIQYMIDYVMRKYNCKKLQTLYDDYKPKYEYKCNYCGKKFFTDKKRRTELVYCSRKCSGNDRVHKHTEDEKHKISDSLKKYYFKNKKI